MQTSKYFRRKRENPRMHTRVLYYYVYTIMVFGLGDGCCGCVESDESGQKLRVNVSFLACIL